MTSKLVRIEAPIKGVFNQMVNVGDEVIIMMTGCGSASLNKGKYLGYVECKGDYRKRAQVEIEYEVNQWFNPDGTLFDWKKDYSYAKWPEVKKTLTIKPSKRIHISTLKLNRIATLKV